jgi:putative hydrolase of the HAD superfamily
VKFKAIIFDLFGTLVDDFISSGRGMYAELAAALAVPHEPFMRLWAQTSEMRTIGAFQTVEASIEYVLDAMNVHAQPEQIKKAVEIRLKYIRQALQPRPNAIETLRQLKNHDYKIGLLSNCSIEIPLLWPETAFVDLIDTPVFSSQVRFKKPDSRIYNLACERLDVRPESCLFIADGEDHELNGAAKAGLNPVLIRIDSGKTSRRVHEEATEWQGTTVFSLDEVLELVENKR